ncbi:sulfatase-like hydrolase/transferase [Wenyingzhuangia sp. 1_MG-2023]|nr:sulfatase-like hydrolase/transferase [Wenyingzhuangia sp. 1_MG-2023]
MNKFFYALLFVFTGLNAQQNKPNILWIVTDDHRADAIEAVNQAVLGQKESKLGYVSSPNINKLAKEGTLFTNAYCNSPACAPSRSSMMTGLYPHHNGVTGFEQAHNKVSITKPMMPQVLKEIGYGTALFGKSGYRILEWDEKKSRPSWTDPGYYDVNVNYKNDLILKGYADFDNKGKLKIKGEKPLQIEAFLFSDGSKLEVVPEAKDAAHKEQFKKVDKKLDILRAYTRKQENMIIGGVSPRPAGETLDGFIVKEYQNYLKHQSKAYQTLSGRNVNGPKEKQPQFVSLNFHLPHTPVLPPKEFRDQFKNKTYKIPSFDKKEELSKLPPQLVKLYQTMKIDGLTASEKQQAVRDYYAFCAYGDALIGKAIQDFKYFSKKNNQEYVIILTVGDHGWQLGEQGIEAKFAPYNTSNNGAIVLAGSNTKLYPKNKVSKAFVEYVDIFTTVLSAAKEDVNSTQHQYLDGIDLSKVARGLEKEKEYVLGEMNHVYGPRAYLRGKDFAFSMRIKEKNSKPGKQVPPGTGLDWARTQSLETVEVALFDLRNDPDERNNVALTKDYKKLTEWFRKKLTNIVLGDGRVEIDWSKKESYKISNFAKGADDKKLDIPSKIIPSIKEFKN